MTVDFPALRTRLDPSDMLGRVLDFPTQMEAAWKIGAEFAASAEKVKAQSFERVVVCGMGGSAIGGDLARSFLGERSRLPILSCRDYHLPANWARNALVVVSSYSGNTGETLSAYGAARKHGASIIAITSGGALADRCATDGVPACKIPGGMPPRAAIGYSLMPMLHVLRATGVASFHDHEYEEALDVSKDRCDAYGPHQRGHGNAAMELANDLHRHTAFVYAAPGLLEGVARRWACQINENAKTLAHFALFPELNHNEIVGWEVGELMQKAVIVALEDRDDHPMTRRQADVGIALMAPNASRVERLETPGGGRLARMLSIMLLGDFMSVYLAYLNDVDPTPVTKIDALKKQLAGQPTKESR